MKKKCHIIKDLAPLYVEDLTSEESNSFISDHIQSCDSCKKYIENMKNDLPNKVQVDLDSDRDDQILIKNIKKGIKRNISKMIWFAILTGILFSAYSPIFFLNLNDTPQTDRLILIILPIVTFLFGILSYVLVKRLWAGPVITLLSGLVSAITFVNFYPLLSITAYAFVSLIGGFVALGLEKVRSKFAKNTLKGLVITASVIVALFSLLVFVFIYSMLPDEAKEKKVIAQAEEYLEEEYPDENIEIYDVLYDNMGNYPSFDYAAKVRNEETDEEFLVYYDSHPLKERVVDTREED